MYRGAASDTRDGNSQDPEKAETEVEGLLPSAPHEACGQTSHG